MSCIQNTENKIQRVQVNKQDHILLTLRPYVGQQQTPTYGTMD